MWNISWFQNSEDLRSIYEIGACTNSAEDSVQIFCSIKSFFQSKLCQISTTIWYMSWICGIRFRYRQWQHQNKKEPSMKWIWLSLSVENWRQCKPLHVRWKWIRIFICTVWSSMWRFALRQKHNEEMRLMLCDIITNLIFNSCFLCYIEIFAGSRT